MEHLLDQAIAWLPNDLERLARILLILALAAGALHAVGRLLPRLQAALVARQPGPEYGRRVVTLSRVLRYALTVVVVAVTAVLVLSELGISVAPILGAAGVVGVAVGFGAQSLVKDFFSGFFLLLENQIRMGDVVEAGGRAGVVEELTLRYLKLRDYSGNVHYVPNGTISVVTNMTMDFAYAVIDVAIAADEDTDRALALLRQTGDELRRDPAFAARIADDLEIAGVENWQDTSLTLRCRFKVVPMEQWNVRRELLRRLGQAFTRAGIRMPETQIRLMEKTRENQAF